MTDLVHLRKVLTAAEPQPHWPAGTHLQPPSATIDPRPLYALLTGAYATGFGTLPAAADWWPSIVADSEYDPELVFVVADPMGAPIGLCLCWNSGFIKDLAVHHDWRSRGLGAALLRTAFASFRRRGFDHVDLKVVASNAPAIRLYRRLGMVKLQSLD